MDDLLTILSSVFETGESIINENEKRFEVRNKMRLFEFSLKFDCFYRQTIENKLQSYLTRAKETLVLKQIAIPKPAKRPMRTIQDEDEETETVVSAVPERRSSELRESIDKVLRPSRTAKVKANSNLVNKTSIRFSRKFL